MFDKNYKLLDAAWDGISSAANQVGATPVVPHDLMSREYTIKEEGYVFMYVSNENATLVDVYFDDIVMTHTKSNVIQYNEYYPFGMQTANSWTRENTTGNNFLGNGGTELNTTTGVYDLHYRNYDPVLGRMTQVDPLADRYSSFSTYNFAFNDPVFWNDVSGADPIKDAERAFEQASSRADREFNNLNKMYGVIGDDDLNGSDFSRYGPGGINSLQGFVYDPVTKRYVTQDFKNGEFGIWEDWSFVYYGEENLSGETWRLATVIKLLQWVPGSLNHYHTMSNRVTQKIHQGQQGFIDNPFGGAMMMLVTGGGLGGGGAIAGRALSGLKAMSPFVIRSGAALGQLTRTSSSIVMSNLVQTGARNGVINLSAQLFFNEGDFGDIDFLDVFTSSIAGNSFVFAGASSAFFDGSINSGFSTAASSSIYSTAVKAATGIAFGSLGGKVGSALGPGGSGFFPELTINIIGSLFGWTLSPPTKR